MARLILVANASKAKFFLASFPGNQAQKWSLIEEVDHPESRAKTSDLFSDGLGSVVAEGAGGHRPKMEPPTDPKDVLIDRFARDIASRTSNLFKERSFDDLAIAASPSFLGCLRSHLDKNLQKKTIVSLDKDFTQTPDHDIHNVFVQS